MDSHGVAAVPAHGRAGTAKEIAKERREAGDGVLAGLERRLLGRSADVVRTTAPRTAGLDAHRLLDLTITLLLLPVFLVVGAIVALVVFVDSPGPIFYRAERIGRGGRPFLMWKFRKMVRDARGPSLTSASDERLTPVGRFLTASRLDELPQVINVLKGDMRLVGPRPEVAEFVACFPDEYAEILTVTPGLTGPAQLRHVGKEARLLANADDAGELYRTKIMPSKVELDLDYVRNRSVARDLVLLARTLVLPVRLMARWVARHAGRYFHRHAIAAAAGMVALLLVFLIQAGPPR